jgi:hypothetical protein
MCPLGIVLQLTEESLSYETWLHGLWFHSVEKSTVVGSAGKSWQELAKPFLSGPDRTSAWKMVEAPLQHVLAPTVLLDLVMLDMFVSMLHIYHLSDI